MDLAQAADPFGLFETWFATARAADPVDATSMALATAAPGGIPAVRRVLLKASDRRGFVFYTNLESRKGRELADNPRAALCFEWHIPHRQVRVEGHVEAVSGEEADIYYHSRPRDSQIGAWASIQSQPLQGPEILAERVREIERHFAEGEIPRPPFWSGFRVVPRRFEFWEGKEFRLHDRIEAVLEGADWRAQWLYP